MKQNGIGQISGIIILMLLAVGGGVGIYATASNFEEIDDISLNTIVAGNADSHTIQAQLYSNDEYGFAFIPPENWTVTETTPNFQVANTYLTVIMEDELIDERIIFSVLDLSMEDLVRNSISVEEEKDILLGNIEATQLSGGDLKDGTYVSLVLAEQGDYLFQITSYADTGTLDNLLAGFIIVG